MGDRMWPALAAADGDRRIHLGNHWRNRWRYMVVRDDVRGPLPRDVQPGEEVEIGIWANVPRQPGVYRLELDMVQESVRWFAKAGSPKATIEVTVDATMPPDSVEGLPPKMEMHGVPRSRVEQIIAEAGGEILAVDDDQSGGVEWISYRYAARVVKKQ